MYPPTIIDVCDFATIQSWNQRGIASTYMRRKPSSVRRSVVRWVRSRRSAT